MMSEDQQVSGRQIAAARVLLGMEQATLAASSQVPVEAVMDIEDLHQGGHEHLRAVINFLQSSGISFIDDNKTSAAGGPGVRLLKSPDEFDTDQSQTVQYPEHLAPDAPTGAGG